MPEGDTIFRTAHRLRQVLAGQSILDAGGNDRYVSAETLVGARVAGVEARGKHLLIHLADGRVIHSHLGMTGSWHVYRPGEPWRKPARAAALSLRVSAPEQAMADFHDVATWFMVVCFSPKTLELLSPTAFRRHRMLQRLGPDLMLDVPSPELVLPRFRLHDLTSIGEAVMNQTIVSGIGNVYKSETLFVTGTNPFQRVQELDDTSIMAIVEAAHGLMQQNLTGYPRRTRHAGAQPRLWVYGRCGQPCLACGATINMRRQGDLGRSTYWCPACQRR